MAEGSDVSDTEELGHLFPEPEGYYKPPPEPTKAVFTRTKATNPYAHSSPEALIPGHQRSSCDWLDSIRYGLIICGMPEKS